MAILEAALRGGAVVLYLLLGIALLRDARRVPAGFYGGLFALGVAAYVVQSAYFLVPQHAWWLVPLRLVCFGNTAVFWLFAAACFDDEFRPGWRHLAPWLGSVGLGAWCLYGGSEIVCYAFEGLTLVFVGLAIRLALVGTAADLVEGRRRFRVVMVILSALYIVAIVAADLVFRDQRRPADLPLANAVGLLAIATVLALRRLAVSDRGVVVALTEPSAERPVPGAAPTPPPVDAEETALLERLRSAMEEGKAYREEGLGIAALSAKLGVPEYRLRRLINQRLGHRNFSAFVNGFRLAEAMAALADPAQVEVPVLTIALDTGFQSIGPFNRTFKAATGMTPTEYRRNRLGRPEGGANA